MAVAGPTLWGSGAIRRRQRPPDDTGSSQSCPGDVVWLRDPAAQERQLDQPLEPLAQLSDASPARARTELN
eukprot:scaffold12605_cov53-Phaeocystis_antarctica.AAC.1